MVAMDAVETVTILFTDVVGSTALRAGLGDDRADALLRLHDEALRSVLAEHHGHEVKHTGDGLMAVFDASSDAVACAVAMHRGVARATRRADGGPVEIRVGISAGDVTRQGDDCFGTPVNEASRLGAVAAPGEVLVTEIVRLLAGSRGAFAFGNAGTRELKGLGTVPAWSVDWTPESANAPLPAGLATIAGAGFVGRDPETQVFEQLWAEGASARHVVLVAGEPGVGKSRFAAECARSVHEKGALVLLGRCEEGVAAPYRPFTEALRQLVDAERDELDNWAATHGAHVEALLPDVRARFAGLPEPHATDPETEQLRMFEAVVALLATVSSRARLLLVLDDLHWADRPSLLLLRHLARANAIPCLFVLGTYRETDLDRSHPLAALLADFRADGHTTRVLLRGLDESETRALVDAWAGHEAGAEFVRAVHRETEGNPFFVRQVLTHLAESGAVTRREDGWGVDRPIERLGIPEGVREVVGRRLSRLGESTNHLLGVASVIGREFDLALLCEVGGEDEDRALDALEPAIAVGLVEEVRDSPGRFAFTHALVRSTLADELLTLRRVRLHQRIGEAIEARGDHGKHLAELAYHFTEAAPAGGVAKAVRYTAELADTLAMTGEFATAQEEFERALQLLDAAGDTDRELRFEVMHGLAWVMSGGRDPRAGWEPTKAALALAQELGSVDRLARTVRFFGNFLEPGQPNELLATSEELLEQVPADDHANRARLLAVQSVLLAQSMPNAADLERVERTAREALRLAQVADDPDATSAAYFAVERSLDGGPHAREALGAMQGAVEAARRCGDTRVLAMAQIRAAKVWLRLGDRHEMEASLRGAAELPITQHAGNVVFRNFGIMRATIAMLEGRFDDATHILDELTDERLEYISRMLGFVQHQWLRSQQGRLRAEVLDRVAEDWPMYPALRSGAALVHAEAGHLDEARARFDDLARGDFAALTFGSGRPLVLAELAEICAHLGDAGRAPRLHALLAPFGGQLLAPYMGSICQGAAARALAQLETVLDRFDDAETHFDAAITVEEAFGAHALVPRTRYWYARMLQRRGTSHDLDAANQLLDEALDATRALGMQPLELLIADARNA